MEKILVSACLLGEKTRYDGKDNLCSSLSRLMDEYELVPFCPEVEGGLPVPREPSEIKGGSVIHRDGSDVTKHFVDGAEKALNLCRYLGIGIAILKDGSPSCGSRRIHDGSFSSLMKDGQGITAARLIAAGIRVYSENDALDFLLKGKEERKSPRHKPYRRFRKDEKKEGREAGERTYRRREEKEGGRRHYPKADGEKGRPYGKKPFKKGGFAHKKPGEGTFEKRRKGPRKPFYKKGEGKTNARKGYFARRGKANDGRKE